MFPPAAAAAAAPTARPAFVAAAPLVPATSSRPVAACRPRAPTACAPANPHPHLSPAALALFKRQAETPIFDPAAAPPPLDARIAALQAQSPPAFLTSAHLAPGAPPARAEAVDHIAARAPALVAEARRHVLRAFPGIDAPGGALHPPFRADACWRDLTAFLRVAAYRAGAAAAANPDAPYSPAGLRVLEAVYLELHVPTDAVAAALAALEQAAARGLSDAAAREVAQAVRPLRDAVAQMRVP